MAFSGPVVSVQSSKKQIEDLDNAIAYLMANGSELKIKKAKVGRALFDLFMKTHKKIDPLNIYDEESLKAEISRALTTS